MSQQQTAADFGQYSVIVATWAPDGEEAHGCLRVAASVDDFTGSAEAELSVDEIESFATLLGSYPLDTRSSIRLSGGYHVGRKYFESVGLSVAALNDRGQYVVHTHLVHQPLPGKPELELHADFLTSSVCLARFGLALTAILRGTIDHADLEFDRLT